MSDEHTTDTPVEGSDPFNWRPSALTVQFVGLVILSIAIGLADVPAGLAVFGFGLIAFGIADEVGKGRE